MLSMVEFYSLEIAMSSLSIVTDAPPTPAGAIAFSADPTALGLRPERAAADLLNVKVQTLRKWAVQRKGPPRTKIGKRVFYREEALRAWLAAQERDPAAARAA
jgi:hypothetical protein